MLWAVDVDAAIADLYGLPLDEFTPARNELAKRLRGEGDRETAERVKELAKPSVAAWTVNQIARRRARPSRRFAATHASSWTRRGARPRRRCSTVSPRRCRRPQTIRRRGRCS